MAVIDLSKQEWSLEGWRPFTWIPGKSMETGWLLRAEVGPFPMRAPGTVQAALRESGVIPDWNTGTQSRDCEWVEHRHWLMETTLPGGLFQPGETVVLAAESLDYSGWILVDCVERARFEGVLTPHRIDLTDVLGDGREHRLALVFEEPPREQGQYGWTSKSRFFKPRFNYSWDWCPRFVPVGVWGRFELLGGASAGVSLRKISTDWEPRTGTGTVTVELDAETPSRWSVRVLDGEVERAAVESFGDPSVTVKVPGAAPWQPNGHGEAKVYTAEVTVRDAAGGVCLRERRQIGFRRVEWRPCEGAPDSAEPWICMVNDLPVFLQGVNWTPVRVNYHDVTEEDYRKRIDLYRETGCTVFRVWGGAMLESETFYDLCDRAGILVWQEFPLSSSGIENAPPDGGDAIAELERIAESYVRRRAHHPSLLLWCAGNELYYGVSPENSPCQKPVDTGHPCIAALAAVVRREDPGRRFLPGSPSGPVDYALEKDFGRGIHHDIHGPWGQGTTPDLDVWRAYWAPDDSLFRSEVGYPGAMDADLMLKYAGDMPCWPPGGEYWAHTAAWWTQWGGQVREALAGLDAEKSLPAYAELTQRIQAEAYAVAAQTCKSRFPRCGGFIIWMGHDCFPCPANNSIIDFEGRPKAACEALRRVFREGDG